MRRNDVTHDISKQTEDEPPAPKKRSLTPDHDYSLCTPVNDMGVGELADTDATAAGADEVDSQKEQVQIRMPPLCHKHSVASHKRCCK